MALAMTVINLCKLIEDEGYEAVPMGHQSDWRAIDNMGYPRKNYSRPVAPGKPVPDVIIDFGKAAKACGLGEMGWSKMLLTPQFGPLQRFAFIFTYTGINFHLVTKRIIAQIYNRVHTAHSTIKRTKNNSLDTGIYYGSRTHRARLKCNIKFASFKPPTA